MNINNAYEHCLNFINCQLQPPNALARRRASGLTRMAVTISRQTGSGGFAIAQRLAESLQASNHDDCLWAVFDRNLVEKVLEDHHLPARVAEFLPEDRTSAISDMMEELLGLHPASRTLVYQTSETILQLLEIGHVIIIGRGANVLAGKRPNIVHVRLIGSVESRVERLQASQKMSRSDAMSFLRRSDQGRARYIRKYFDQNIDDPLLYDLVLNTDQISPEAAAHVIAETVRCRAEAIASGSLDVSPAPTEAVR